MCCHGCGKQLGTECLWGWWSACQYRDKICAFEKMSSIQNKCFAAERTHPCMGGLYNMGAWRRRPSLLGSVFCVVDTPVRMQSSMTAQMRKSCKAVIRHLKSPGTVNTDFVVDILFREPKVAFVIMDDLSNSQLRKAIRYQQATGLPMLKPTLCFQVNACRLFPESNG